MDTIQEVLDRYYKSWNEGFKSKNGDDIRKYMSKSFIGFWAHSNLNHPEQYDYNYDINAVLQQYDENTEMTLEPLSITERNNGDEHIILGTKISIINGTPAYAKCMFIWKREENNWKLLREFIEIEK
ncbi:DUF4440 domain-containing protein [Cytobacillus sp. Hm23]